MKNIKIKKISLTNWKGQSKEVTFSDKKNIIKGRNRSGKTTLFKAWCWLLTGYSDPSTPKNSDLFDNTKELTKDTPIASVSAVIDIDGITFMLERTAQSKFVRRRGMEVWEKAPSDDYKYFVDGIEYSATDFAEWITANITDGDLLKYAIDGNFFISQIFSDKKKSRQIIEQMIGSVTRDEMKGDYSILDAQADKYTVEQLEAQAATMIKSINNKLDTVCVEIKNVQSEIDAISQTDFGAIQKKIDDAEKKRKSVNDMLFDLSARMRPVLEARTKAEEDKRMKETLYQKQKEAYMKSYVDADVNLCLEISKAEEDNARKTKQIAELKVLNAEDEKALSDAEERIQKLRDKKEEIKNQPFEFEEKCIVCGQPMPEGARETAYQQFLAYRKTLIDGVVAQGKDLKKTIDGIKSRIEKRANAINVTTFTDITPLKERLNNLRKSDSVCPFEDTELGKSLQSEIDSIVIPPIEMTGDEELKQSLHNIQEELKGLYLEMGAKQRLAELQQKLENLKASQKTCGASLVTYEQQKRQVADYRQEQVEILSKKINNRLHYSSLDVWSKQKDGTIVPDIVLKDSKGVNYATTNTASRIITTVDVQRLFCELLDVNMPVFIDEVSVLNTDNIPQYDGTQTFLLSCADTPLTVTTE